MSGAFLLGCWSYQQSLLLNQPRAVRMQPKSRTLRYLWELKRIETGWGTKNQWQTSSKPLWSYLQPRSTTALLWQHSQVLVASSNRQMLTFLFGFVLVGKYATKKLLYFEWSPPWHVGWRLSGEGCHWEYDGKNGEFENINFRFPWLRHTSEMGFGHDVPFLNYSDRLPHPSDLCQPDRVRWG